MILQLLLLIVFIVAGVGLVIFMLSRDRGAKEPIGALWVAALFGLLSVVASVFFEAILLPREVLESGGLSTSVFVTYMAVGFIEEIAKFLPLALFIYKKSYFNEHTDGIIYFAISGLTFGLIENIGYTIIFGVKAGALRVILLPIFHGASTAMIGFFLARAKVEHKSLFTVLLALIGVAFLHGLYDFGVVSKVPQLTVMSLMITTLITISLFLFYMKSTELDKSYGLSTVGVNNFCRFCGKPNTGHSLYCVNCGRKT